MATHPVWLEGDGFIDSTGRYYPETNVCAALRVAADMVAWFNQLSAETQDVLRWEAELRGTP